MRDSLEHYEQDTEKAILLLPPEPDRLGVLTSTLPVVEEGELVWINTDSLDKVVPLLSATPLQQAQPASMPTWYARYHFNDGSERTVNWVLLLDALNFCFWAEKGQPRWQIEYKGELLNGYWAEAAALTRAVEEGIPLWDAHYLSTTSKADLEHIFRGVSPNNNDTPVTIPLLEQRLENAREVGRVLLEAYDGQFIHAIEEANGSAVTLALLLAERFPSFNDIAIYRNRTVRFYKRAQICVADLYGAFAGERWGAFSDLDSLTIFADYKLPQILRHFGVLEYHPTLANRVDRQELIPAGSEEEVEIRAATVWACEMLRQLLAEQEDLHLTAAEIDQRLWHLSQDIPDMRPYHRTRTIFY